MEQIPVRVVRSVLTGIFLFVLAVLIVFFLFPQSVARMPHINPDTSALQIPPVIVSHTFPFEEGNITITIPVNASVYSGARRADKNTIIIQNSTDQLQVFYLSMINEPSQEPIYTDLLSQFRLIRSRQNLSDDEYLELMTVYTQSLPYVASQDPAKFPVETVMEQNGDCDDKSLLLAGLLSREDYPVVLFLFGPEKHMALGIGSYALPYKSTGYAYLETTDYAYIGIPSWILKNNSTLTSDPLVIPISNGTKLYRSGSETSFIDNMSALSGQKAAALSLKLRVMPASAAENRSEYLANFAELTHYAKVHTYVLSHKYDRMGVYAYLKEEMLGESM